MLLEIKSRSANIKDISTDEFSVYNFTNDIFELLEKETGLRKNRLRLTYEKGGKRVPLEINKQLKLYGFPEKTEIQVKDLGPQIDWKLVFIIEYLGPIIIHSLFFYGYRSYLGDYPVTITQTVLYDLTLLHFLKREYETLFVHKFSNATMPIFNIFKNSFHYWILNGVLCSVFVYAPVTLKYSDNVFIKYLFRTNDFSLGVSLGLAAIILALEFATFSIHANLAAIRQKDPKNYEIPYGFGFKWVSCPNYFFETLVFIGFTILSGNWSYALFTIIAFGQMYIWAVAKHKRYLKTFGDKYKSLNRKVIIPFVI